MTRRFRLQDLDLSVDLKTAADDLGFATLNEYARQRSRLISRTLRKEGIVRRPLAQRARVEAFDALCRARGLL